MILRCIRAISWERVVTRQRWASTHAVHARGGLRACFHLQGEFEAEARAEGGERTFCLRW